MDERSSLTGAAMVPALGGGLDPELLSQSLSRCTTADELRLQAELKARALHKRLEQGDKVHMSLKMQLKMRDAEVKRFRARYILHLHLHHHHNHYMIYSPLNR